MQKIDINKRITVVSENECKDYSLKKILGNLDFDLLIYWHKPGPYDGEGYAVWRHDGKWAYVDLNHCSCDDEVDRMIGCSDKAKFKESEMKTIIENEIKNAFNDTNKLYTGKLLDVFIKETA